MTKRSRRAAIHEAGHALAHWWNGQLIYCATVRTRAEMRAGPHVDQRGRESDLEGLVEASNFISSPDLLLRHLQHGQIDDPLLPEMIARDLLHCCAGPVAEAIHSRIGLESVLWAGGYDDMESACELLSLMPEAQRDEVDRQAFARCRVLVRRYWPAVEALADLLQERGHVEGEDVGALLCTVTGESPKFCGNQLVELDKLTALPAVKLIE